MTQTSTTRKSAARKGDNTLVLVIAIALGILAVILNLIYIWYVGQSTKQRSIEVWTLRRNVVVRDTFKPADYDSQTVPESFKPALTRLKFIIGDDIKSWIGHKLENSGTMGDPVTSDLFRAEAREDSLSNRIEIGQRQKSLPINSRTTPGDLKPGDWVDIDAPFPVNGGGIAVYPVLERVQIIALGSSSMYDETDPTHTRQIKTYSTITIAVEPTVATDLETIERIVAGDFLLTVRNPRDKELVKIPKGGVGEKVQGLLLTQAPGDTNSGPRRRGP